MTLITAAWKPCGQVMGSKYVTHVLFANTVCTGESYFSPTPLDSICGLSTRDSPENLSDPLTHAEAGLGYKSL